MPDACRDRANKLDMHHETGIADNTRDALRRQPNERGNDPDAFPPPFTFLQHCPNARAPTVTTKRLDMHICFSRRA